ncbi:MAG: hypothetical protein OHK0039_03580 [Bacteroidia bacterium]
MATNNLFEQWSEAQKQMMDKWSLMAKDMTKGFGMGESIPMMPMMPFNEWYQQQRKLLENAMNPERTQQMMGDLYESYQKTMQNQLEEWMKMINQMIDVSKSMMNPYVNFGRAGQYSQVYQDMMRMWEPVLSAIRGGNPMSEGLSAMLNPASFQEMMGKLLNVNMPEALNQMATQANKMFSDYSNWVGGQTAGFTRQFPTAMPGFEHWPANMGNWFLDFQDRIEKQFGSYSTLLNQGKRGQMTTLILEAQKEYINYALKATELQQHMTTVAQKALPKTIEHFAQEYSKTNQLPEYDAFFRQYIDVLEADLVALFETPEYSKLQSDIGVSGVRVKNRLEKFMELVFEGAPFTMRSETDEIAQELQALRRRVRMLERQMKDTPAAPATAANGARPVNRSRGKKVATEPTE